MSKFNNRATDLVCCCANACAQFVRPWQETRSWRGYTHRGDGAVVFVSNRCSDAATIRIEFTIVECHAGCPDIVQIKFETLTGLSDADIWAAPLIPFVEGE